MTKTLQLDELEALKSIYSEECQVIEKEDNQNVEAVFWIHVNLPENYLIKYKDNPSADEYACLSLNHLPPFELHLTLPESYPLNQAPQFTLSCKWLTKWNIGRICKQLDQLWEDNIYMEIIYIWIDFLKCGALEFLGFEKELDITELHFCHLNYIQHRQGTNNRNAEQCGNKQDDPELNVESNVLSCKNVKVPDSSLPVQSNVNASYLNDVRFRKRQNAMKLDVNGKQGLDKRAKLDLHPILSPVQELIHYSKEKDNIEFQKQPFTCNICFCEKFGVDCLKFEGCSHIFCRDCILLYFTVKINDGTVKSIKCPDSDCSTDATPLQVKTVVPAELFAKYDTLLLYSTLHSMDQIIYCPRSFCQYPACRESEDNLVICPNCQYVFCFYCKRTYHGVQKCELKAEERRLLIEKYCNSSQEDKEKLELRYGKVHLRNLLNDSLAEDWIVDNCRNCPKCNVSIQKSTGCNKMVCWKCNTFFCWLCSAELDPGNPYTHFNDSKSRCANKLFYMMPVEDVDEDNDEEDDDDEDDYDSDLEQEIYWNMI